MHQAFPASSTFDRSLNNTSDNSALLVPISTASSATGSAKQSGVLFSLEQGGTPIPATKMLVPGHIVCLFGSSEASLADAELPGHIVRLFGSSEASLADAELPGHIVRLFGSSEASLADAELPGHIVRLPGPDVIATFSVDGGQAPPALCIVGGQHRSRDSGE